MSMHGYENQCQWNFGVGNHANKRSHARDSLGHVRSVCRASPSPPLSWSPSPQWLASPPASAPCWRRLRARITRWHTSSLALYRKTAGVRRPVSARQRAGRRRSPLAPPRGVRRKLPAAGRPGAEARCAARRPGVRNASGQRRVSAGRAPNEPPLRSPRRTERPFLPRFYGCPWRAAVTKTRIARCASTEPDRARTREKVHTRGHTLRPPDSRVPPP